MGLSQEIASEFFDKSSLYHLLIGPPKATFFS